MTHKIENQMTKICVYIFRSFGHGRNATNGD